MQWRIGLIVAALVLGACEGSEGGGSPMGSAEPPALVPVSQVELTPQSGATTIGGTIQFTVTALDEHGNVLAGRAVTWEAMNSSVAAISRGGLVRGLANGTSQIRASVEGVTAFARFEVGGERKPEFKPEKPDGGAE